MVGGGGRKLRRVFRTRIVLPILLVLYVLAAVSTARVSAPLPNEAWFYSPAENLVKHGFMGTTNLVVEGTWLEGIEQRTYWIPPAHILAQAGWYALFGAGLAQMRALSVAWGVAALLFCYRIGVRLGVGRWGSLLAVGLLAVDFRWALTGSFGRMDMMSASLGLAGVAAYLSLRERSFGWALVVGHGLVTASCLTHPCGVVHGVALLILMLLLDRQRLSVKSLGLSAAPYVVGLAGWGMYIAQDPAGFERQFRGNISGLAAEAGHSTRFSGLRHPWDALKEEASSRYFSQFGNWGGGKVFGGLQMYVLGLYLAAIAGALWDQRRRRNATGQALGAIAVAVFSIFWLLDGSKSSAYLPHVLPWLLLMAGYAIRRLAPGQMALIATLLGVVMVAQGAAFVGWARKDRLHRESVAAVRYLETHVRNGELVNGGAEYQFFVGDGGALRFVDDQRLGYLTGRRPDWILLSGWYQGWTESVRKRDARFDGYLKKLLVEESREVFHVEKLKIYRVGPAAQHVSGAPAVLH